MKLSVNGISAGAWIKTCEVYGNRARKHDLQCLNEECSLFKQLSGGTYSQEEDDGTKTQEIALLDIETFIVTFSEAEKMYE